MRPQSAAEPELLAIIFFTTWKGADPDIPILRQANAEYKKLTATTSAAVSASLKKQ